MAYSETGESKYGCGLAVIAAAIGGIFLIVAFYLKT